MFKGLKRVVKGGISTVAEKGTDLASNVVNDSDLRPASFKEKITEGAKKTFKDGTQFVSEGGEDIKDKVANTKVDDVADKTKEVAHNIKHYGAFGEGYLGYSDPGKELRKAVKAKEKAAKKAKKAKKKKGEKAEDLFDPENLAKYKKEIEEKRNLASELSPGLSNEGSKSKSGSPTSVDGEKLGQPEKWDDDKQSDEFDFNSPTHVKSPTGSQSSEQIEDWRKQLNALTSGVDDLVKQKKDKLDEIKVDSFYQRKKTQDEIDEDSKVARPKTLVVKRKKHWEDLDADGFKERDGVIDADVSDTEDITEEEERPETKEPTPEVEEKLPSEDEKEEGNEVEKEEEAEENEDDIFNTEFVNETLAVLDLKLAVIPDSPVEEDDDIFDTKYATDIVEKAEKEKIAREKAENNKIKFGCISAAADVLTGKATSVDKNAIQQTLKKKRRRANRINLIADEADDVTALEDIEGIVEVDESKPKPDVFGELGALDIPVGDLLTSTPSPCVIPTTPKQEEANSKPTLDLSEFDAVHNESVALTSNVALLSAEFCEAAPEEEEDPFDEAFDQLAKESITKTKLEEIEADLFDDDLFDTTKADVVLNLASLTNVINKTEEEEIVLDTFDDKDPFDTSAYDHITKDLEEDLEFESLAKRDPNELGTCAADIGPDPFEVVDQQISQNRKEDENDGWAEFDQIKRKKPSRPPPPPRPTPPRPAPPSRPPAVQIDYASGRNTPSVIIKAPSSDSIKSWNVTQSDTLILKCNIEALEASALEEEGEADPFDTTEFEGIVKELKIKEADPFDTSSCTDVSLGPSKTELKLIENEILIGGNKNNELGEKSNLDLLSEQVPEPNSEEDPFDTGFVEELLPNKGDPFNTDHVDEEDDEDFDPFDTTAADEVIPVRKPKVSQKSTVSIEDDSFDPSAAFVVKKSKARPAPPPRPSIAPIVDPFATTDVEPVKPVEVLKPKKKEHTQVFVGRSRPKTLEKIEAEKKKLEEELLNEFGGPLQRSLTDEDFDPRGFDSSPVKEKTPSPVTPESPDPFDTDGIDPFDTSAVQIAG